MLKTAGINSFCDRDQRQRCPECLFRRLGYAVRYTAEVRGSLCCSFLCPSIATDIRGYVRVDCRFGVNLSDEGGFCQKCEGKTNLALSTWKKQANAGSHPCEAEKRAMASLCAHGSMF